MLLIKTILRCIFAILIVLTGCNKSNNMSNIDFLALGDSYTIGESVAPEKSWPIQLSKALSSKNIQSNVHIIAKTGWTTAELDKAIEQEKIQTTSHLVSLSIGVNNQYRGYNRENYRKEFRALLKKAIQFANNRPENVIVVSIPDWGVTPFGHKDKRGPAKIGEEIAAFNQINLEETQKNKCHYVDITPISKQALNKKSLTAPDGLHPSAEMYSLWVEKIFPIAYQIGSK